MKLKELYKDTYEGKTLIAIGNKTESIYQTAGNRIGFDRFYVLLDNEWYRLHHCDSCHDNVMLALEEKDFLLFNAYDSLPEGFFENYKYLNMSGGSFHTDDTNVYLSADQIYARKKKEPELTIHEKAKALTPEGAEYLGDETQFDKKDMDMEKYEYSFLFDNCIGEDEHFGWGYGTYSDYGDYKGAPDPEYHWWRRPKPDYKPEEEELVEPECKETVSKQRRKLFNEWYTGITGGDTLPESGECQVYSSFCQMAITFSNKGK